MSGRGFFFLVVCVGAMLTNGCMWSRVKINGADVPTRAKVVRPQVTKAADLQKLMHQTPNNILPLKNGKQIYVYTSGESKTKGFDLLIISISKTNTEMDSAYVLIDEQGMVESVSVGKPSEIPWEWWAFGE